MRSGESRAQANKRIRQEALREQLRSQGHLQHLVDLIEKVEDFKKHRLDANKIARLRLAMENRRYLINKYLPDLKAIEISGSLDIREMTDEQLDAELEAELTGNTD